MESLARTLTPSYRLQKILTNKAQSAAQLACMSRIRSNHGTNNSNSTTLLTINARMLATSAPGASTWISATAFDSNTTIDNASFKLAIRFRLGLAPFDIMPKECHSCRVYDPRNLSLVEKNEWHWLSCVQGHGGREFTLRHNQIVLTLARFLRLAGAPTSVEPKHVYSETGKQPDLLTILNHKVYLIDVTIVNPTAPSNLVHAQRMLGAATEAEKRKIRKYDELSSQQNYTFIPFVIETYGGIGKKAQTFLDALSVFAHDNMTVCSRFDVVNGLKYAIACSLQRGNSLIAHAGYANAVRVYGQDY